jgi:hypothetical protein
VCERERGSPVPAEERSTDTPSTDWPGSTGASHKFTVDPEMLQHVGRLLKEDAALFTAPVGDLTPPPEGTWGTWDIAPRTRSACENAMHIVTDVYEHLIKEYQAIGPLLLRTAQEYKDSDAQSHPAAHGAGKDPLTGDWNSGA